MEMMEYFLKMQQYIHFWKNIWILLSNDIYLKKRMQGERYKKKKYHCCKTFRRSLDKTSIVVFDRKEWRVDEFEHRFIKADCCSICFYFISRNDLVSDGLEKWIKLFWRIFLAKQNWRSERRNIFEKLSFSVNTSQILFLYIWKEFACCELLCQKIECCHCKWCWRKLILFFRCFIERTVRLRDS